MDTLRILIVDDDPDTRDVLAYILKHEGFDVLQANDATSGIRCALQHRPDALLMDAVMPGEIDGFEATRRLRAAHAYDGPIVIQSALARAQDIQRGMAQGADAYLVKPFRRQDVLETLSMVVGYAGSSPVA